MSSDLATGRTPAGRPASSSHTKGGLSVHMAPTHAPVLGAQMTPQDYFKRKVALLTGQSRCSATANHARSAGEGRSARTACRTRVLPRGTLNCGHRSMARSCISALY